MTEIVIMEGVVSSARVGSSKFDDTVKNRLSIRCEVNNIPFDKIDECYANVGRKLTPKWVSERNGYVNVASKFDIPVKLSTGKIITFEEFTEMTTCLGSKVRFNLRLKEGVCYPIAIVVIEPGEEINPFDGLE